MNYITSNIPYFKAWVRREYTTNFDRYQGEFLHAMVIAVTTLPMKTLSFQVIFTGCEDDPILEPQVEQEEQGSYGNLSLPNEQNVKKKNPKIF